MFTIHFVTELKLPKLGGMVLKTKVYVWIENFYNELEM